jgi:hypothetical protein
MADIDTALGEQIRDTLAKEFGEVNTTAFGVGGEGKVICDIGPEFFFCRLFWVLRPLPPLP